MPISTLDDTTALVVVDLQAGTMANPTAHPIASIVANAAALADEFRARGLPVVLANVTGTPPGRSHYSEGSLEFPAPFSVLAPELGGSDNDILVTRGTWSAFAGTELAETLLRHGVTQIVLAGMATSFGIESSARHAYDLGFNVAIALDAITDPNPQAHVDSTTRVFPVLGQTGTTAEILSALRERTPASP